MKLFLKSLSAVLFLASLKAAAATLDCKTQNKVSGWSGGRTFDHIRIEARVKGGALVSPVLSGAFDAHLLGAVLGTKSENGKWVRYSGMEGESCWYKLIVPSNLEALEGQSFRGVVDKSCENGHKSGSYRLNCSVR